MNEFSASTFQHLNFTNSSSNSKYNGRWTHAEHIKFLEGLSKYGKNWKKIEGFLKTRDGAQIRSHAQKFFMRMTKEYKKIIKVNGGESKSSISELDQNTDNKEITFDLEKLSDKLNYDENNMEDYLNNLRLLESIKMKFECYLLYWTFYDLEKEKENLKLLVNMREEKKNDKDNLKDIPNLKKYNSFLEYIETNLTSEISSGKSNKRKLSDYVEMNSNLNEKMDTKKTSCSLIDSFKSSESKIENYGKSFTLNKGKLYSLKKTHL